MRSKLAEIVIILALLLLIYSLILRSQIREINKEIDSLENRIENLRKPVVEFPTLAVGGINDVNI